MLLTLNYHRICPFPSGVDCWGLAVSASNFEDHLKLIVNAFDLFDPFHDSVAAALNDERTHILITFDDGYADIGYAIDLLIKHNAYGVLFLAPAFIDEPDFWWHNLEDVHYARLSSIAKPSVDAIRQAIYPDWKRAHGLPWHHRQKVARTIYAATCQLDRPAYSLSTARRMPMTSQDLVNLLRSSRILLGSHTLTHAYLPSIEDAEMCSEILGGEHAISLLQGRPSFGFAYPYGEHTPKAVELISKSDIDYAFTIEQPRLCAKSTPELNRHLLPRLVVQDWSYKQFEAQINSCFQSQGELKQCQVDC